MKKAVLAGLTIIAGSSLHGEMDVKRNPNHAIEDLLLSRWSPRAMSGEALSQKELMTLFEAARWAPSSYNSQPWRFVYAEKDSEHWSTFFNFLVEFNQSWCKNAAALIVIISKKTFDFNGEFSRTHSFDTGASWENLALQGHAMGLVVHGMSGFDYDAVRTHFNLSDEYAVEAMVAVGKPGDVKRLPEALQEKEEESDRRPIDEIVFNGDFIPKK